MAFGRGLEHHVLQLVWVDIAECVWKQLIHHPLTRLLSCLAVFGLVVEVALCRRVMRHDRRQHAHLRLGRSRREKYGDQARAERVCVDCAM